MARHRDAGGSIPSTCRYERATSMNSSHSTPSQRQLNYGYEQEGSKDKQGISKKEDKKD